MHGEFSVCQFFEDGTYEYGEGAVMGANDSGPRVTMSYVNRRGAHCVRYWHRLTAETAAEVERAILTRFNAREETTVRLDDEHDPVGGVERLDRWTWWLDATSLNAAAACPGPTARGL